MKKVLIIIAIGLIGYSFYNRKPEPKIGQIYERTIELSYGYGYHVDTVLILNLDETTASIMCLDNHEEWLCPIGSIKQYGRLLK